MSQMNSHYVLFLDYERWCLHHPLQLHRTVSFNCLPALQDPALDESDRLRKEGKELMEAGHPELAIERYTSVLERHPSDLRACNNRAQVTTQLEAARYRMMSEAYRNSGSLLEGPLYVSRAMLSRCTARSNNINFALKMYSVTCP